MVNPQIVLRDDQGRFINGWVKKYPIKRICNYCGNEFIINDGNGKNKKYCNIKCYHNSRIGIKDSEKTKNKKSSSNIGKHNRLHTEIEKEKIKLTSIGRKWTIERRLKISEDRKGDKTHLWKGGKDKKIYKHYNNAEYKIWREQIFERDNYTCQKCGVRSQVGRRIYLHPHHIKSYTYYPQLRYDINNGVTLCKECHLDLHSIKGSD